MKWATLATGQPRHGSAHRYSDSVDNVPVLKVVQIKKAVRVELRLHPANWIDQQSGVSGSTTTVTGTYRRWQSSYGRNSRPGELHSNVGSTHADEEQNDPPIATVLSSIIHQLIRWRTADNLSQPEAVRILEMKDFP